MVTITDDELPVYQEFDTKLHINYNLVSKEITDINENTRTVYKYQTAISTIFASRAELINDIIRSQHTQSDEFAIINDATAKPERYAQYQEFRVLAKKLADDYLKSKIS